MSTLGGFLGHHPDETAVGGDCGELIRLSLAVLALVVVLRP